MKKFIIFTLLSFSLFACKNTSKMPDYDFTVKVVAVTDGDTFKGLTADNKQITFRMQGIDAPEKKQAYGNRSKEYLSELIFDKTVLIKIQTKSDRYGRHVVWVYTLDGKDVSAEMLKAGMAWHYKQYDKSEEYANLENQARRKQTGLWKDKNPTPPWEYRKAKKK